jgi:protein kinase-like protein/FHA domain-containing protein
MVIPRPLRYHYLQSTYYVARWGGAMAKRLVVVAGPDEGKSFPLAVETLLLGRSRATDTRLIDPHVSRVHCEIQQTGDGLLLRDFETPGGTFLNGQRITQPHPLEAGDLIRIGLTHLQVIEDDGAVPIAKPVGPVAAAKGRAKPHRPGDWAQSLVGKTFGRYQLTSILARGKSGFIFHARDTKKSAAIVVKVLDAAFSRDVKKVQRFVKAMKAVLPLRHPHLVRVYGAGKTEGYCWVAKEYVPGESLAAVIGRIDVAGHLDWRRVAHLAFHIGKALMFAHSRKLVHQNVTPHNILLGQRVGETKLSDLMLATALEEDPTTPISAAGVPSESLAYMPPERTDGPGHPVDARADIYSLGATLYAMLAGRPPFQSALVSELVQKIRLEAPPPLAGQNGAVPAPLEAMVRRMLAKRPQDRYQTMREFLKELQGFVKGEPPQP